MDDRHTILIGCTRQELTATIPDDLAYAEYQIQLLARQLAQRDRGIERGCYFDARPDLQAGWIGEAREIAEGAARR